MIGMRLGIGVKQGIRQVQRLEQKVRFIPWRPRNWLTGTAKDFERLLTTDPPIDSSGRVRYIVGGGWASEIHTGKVREHHDLDVVLVDNSVPLSYSVDQQSADNYFGTFSLTQEELLKSYVDVVKWNPHATRPSMKDKTYKVPVLNEEFLMLSKTFGFLRAPRPKDMDDIESLAMRIRLGDDSYARIENLLKHIPGLHPDFEDNRALFADLGGEGTTAYQRAANHMMNIIGQFQIGNTDHARNQIDDFHKTLKKIYEEGLKHTTVVDAREELVKDAWKTGNLDGFWVLGENGPEYRIFPNDRNNYVKRSLETIAKAEKTLGVKSQINWGKQEFGLVRFGSGSVLIDPNLGVHSKIYRPNNITYEGEQTIVSEKKRTILIDQNLSEIITVNRGRLSSMSEVFDVLLDKGKYVAVRKIMDTQLQKLKQKHNELGLELACPENKLWSDAYSALAVKIEQSIIELATRYLENKDYRARAKMVEMASVLELDESAFSGAYKKMLLKGNFKGACKIASILGITNVEKLGTQAIDYLISSSREDQLSSAIANALKIMDFTGAKPTRDGWRLNYLGHAIWRNDQSSSFEEKIATFDGFLKLYTPDDEVKDNFLTTAYSRLLSSDLENASIIRHRISEGTREIVEKSYLDEIVGKLVEARKFEGRYSFEARHIPTLNEKKFEYLEWLKEVSSQAKPSIEEGKRLYFNIMFEDVVAKGTNRLSNRVAWAERIISAFGISEQDLDALDLDVYEEGLIRGSEPVITHLRGNRGYDASTDSSFFLKKPELYRNARSIRILHLQNTPEIRAAGYSLLEKSIQSIGNQSCVIRELVDKFKFSEDEIWELGRMEIAKRIGKEDYESAGRKGQSLVAAGLVSEQKIKEYFMDVVEDLRSKEKYREAAYASDYCMRDRQSARVFAVQALEKQQLNPIAKSYLRSMYSI